MHSIVMDLITYSRTKRVLHNTALLLTDARHGVIQARAPQILQMDFPVLSHPTTKSQILAISAVMRLLNLLVGEGSAKMWKLMYDTHNLNH